MCVSIAGQLPQLWLWQLKRTYRLVSGKDFQLLLDEILDGVLDG